MKKWTVGIAALLMLLASSPVFAAGEGWTDDFEAAKKQAAEQGKDIMIDVTGTDW
jgi:hypothetical protein